MKTREKWGSQLGFILAVGGSAIGLVNIWRIPYLIGSSGGAAFLAVYLLCLGLVGLPVFLCEALIGRTTQAAPSSAFRKLGGNAAWSWGGKLTIATGFLVSSFYSVVAGWILGYLFEVIRGGVAQFETPQLAAARYQLLVSDPSWTLLFHLIFLLMSAAVLFFGVRRGIERGTKVMMPLLFVMLVTLVAKGLALDGAWEGVEFLFRPDWRELTPVAILTALGHAFFTLSLGQGTMVTYGSYLSKKDHLLKSGVAVVAMDTLVALLAAVAVFSIGFSAGVEPDAGPGLIFQTLPFAFSQLQGGYLFALLFFFLVVLAALTSQISAMEPMVAYLVEEWRWGRKRAVCLTAFGVFLLGIPSALSMSLLSRFSLFGYDFLDGVSLFCSNVLIPLGGFLAVILVGWVWGADPAVEALEAEGGTVLGRSSWLQSYFRVCFKYIAPLLMGMIFIRALLDW